MRLCLLIFIFGCLFELNALAQKAVLIEDFKEDAVEAKDSAVRLGRKVEQKIETKRGSFLREKRAIAEVFTSEYDSTYSMRADRRVGVGVELAGKLGLLGVSAELNFSLDDSALIGFGGGPQYSTFEMGWRHVFGGRILAPYAGAAFARWYNNSETGGSIGNTTPSFLGQKFLSDSDKQTGKFAVNILTPSVGLQYNMLNGPYVGTSLYAEVMMLLSLSNFQNVLTGAFGATYYF